MIIIGSRPGQDDIYGWYLHLVFYRDSCTGRRGGCRSKDVIIMNMADGRTRMGRMVWAAEEREEGEGGERREEKGRGGEGEGEGEERMKRARETEMRSRVRRTARLDGHRTRDPLYVTGACRAVVVEGEARTGRDRTRRDRTRQKQTRLDSSQEERTGSW